MNMFRETLCDTSLEGKEVLKGTPYTSLFSQWMKKVAGYLIF